jgi:hypothetical protein
MGIKYYELCFDCMTKEWRSYPWSIQWVDWKCEICWLEGKDIWLKWNNIEYKWDCMIWDVLDWIRFESKKHIVQKWANMDSSLKLRNWFRKPIDDQSEETIDFIFSLLN